MTPSAAAAARSSATSAAGAAQARLARSGICHRPHRSEHRKLPAHVAMPARAGNATIGVAHRAAQLERSLAVMAHVLV